MDNDADTVFRDVFTIALLGFVAIVLLLLPYLNPPSKEDSLLTPESLVVEILWGDYLHSDVDLWVRAPKDKPVGYTNKSGTVFNLLRDDLGSSSDLLPINYEVAYTRGVPDGDYVVNIALYSDKDPLPLEVTVILSRRSKDGTMVTLLTRTVELTHYRQELTVLRFTCRDGVVLMDSVHNLPLALWHTR